MLEDNSYAQDRFDDVCAVADAIMATDASKLLTGIIDIDKDECYI